MRSSLMREQDEVTRLRLAIISDIHGNIEALRNVLADIDALHIQEIVCLGDCIGYGPDPEAVLTEIRRRQIPTIMGNHEQAVCNPHQLEWFNPLAQRSLRMTLSMLSEASLEYIQHLPISLVVAQSFCVHGYPPDSVRTYLFQKSPEALAQTIGAMKQTVCFVGHTHDLEIVSYDGRRLERRVLEQGLIELNPQHGYIINVGSVGQPRDGNNNAKYAIYDAQQATLEIRFIPYDIASTAARIKAAGLPENHARRLW
jgi:predicted phosphodiesterase